MTHEINMICDEVVRELELLNKKFENVMHTADMLDVLDKSAVVTVVENLREILFTSFYGAVSNVGKTEANTAHTLSKTMILLENQIHIALRMQDSYKVSSSNGAMVTNNFVRKLPMIYELLITDVVAAFEGDPAATSMAEIVLSYPGFFSIMVNRFAHELYVSNVPLIPRLMSEYAHGLTGIDIHPGAHIGKSFFIDHGTGTVIGETSIIGDNVRMYQGVTLGALSTAGGQNLRTTKRHPTIMNNVTIYAGASVLGGETIIGNDVVIGANAFVTKSVPSGERITFRDRL